MKLEDVGKVKYAYTEKEVNEYLDKGYDIVRYYNAQLQPGNDDHQIGPVCILGKKRSKKE